MQNEKLDAILDKIFPGFIGACFESQATGPAEVSSATRDSVLPRQGGECAGLAQIVGQCG